MLSCNWLEKASASDTLTKLLTLAHLEVARIINGKLRTDLETLLKNEDWAGILDYDLDYTANYSVTDVLAARQCLGYFQKLEPLGDLLKIDRKAKAYEKFLETEQACRLTNEFFESWNAGDLCLLPSLDAHLHAAKWKISKILGPVPSFGEFFCKLGPGATTTVRRRESVPSIKLHGTISVAANSLPYVPIIFANYEHLWKQNGVHREDGDFDVWSVSLEESEAQIEFVPKDAKSYRTILKVPTLTGFCQLGIGDYLAERLRKNGIDITNQTANQNLARYGSVSGALATLDLSSASDTIARELVRFLLPEDWFSLLSCFNEQTARYGTGAKSVYFRMEKFSAMGNGFSFPLETMIFYALLWAASPHHERSFINAYGDDLVCSSDRAIEICTLLEQCGFTVNRRKSFTEGPFRESCGADYYFGINVRPYRQKELLSGEGAFVLHNFHKRNFDDEMAQIVRSWIPEPLILEGPDGYGDGHLLTDRPLLQHHRRGDGWSGYTFETYSRVAKRSCRLLPGDYISLLYTLYTRGPSDPDRPKEVGRLIAPLPIASGYRLVKNYPGGSETVYKRTKIYTLTG